MNKTSLGKSDLQVPRLGVGAMTWGDPSGLARWTLAKARTDLTKRNARWRRA